MLKEVVDFAPVPGVHVTDSAVRWLVSESQCTRNSIATKLRIRDFTSSVGPSTLDRVLSFGLFFHIYAFGTWDLKLLLAPITSDAAAMC